MTRRRDLAAADLEDLLDGRPSAVDPVLATVLSAARAPGGPEELIGLNAALKVFVTRSVRPVTPTVVRGLASGVAAVVSGWPVRLLAALAASTAVAGVSLAAITGTLPGAGLVPSVTAPLPVVVPVPSVTAPPTSTKNPVVPATTPPISGRSPFGIEPALPTLSRGAAGDKDPSTEPGASGEGAVVPEQAERSAVSSGEVEQPTGPSQGTPGSTRPTQADEPSRTATTPSAVPKARTTDSPEAARPTPTEH